MYGDRTRYHVPYPVHSLLLSYDKIIDNLSFDPNICLRLSLRSLYIVDYKSIGITEYMYQLYHQ